MNFCFPRASRGERHALAVGAIQIGNDNGKDDGDGVMATTMTTMTTSMCDYDDDDSDYLAKKWLAKSDYARRELATVYAVGRSQLHRSLQCRMINNEVHYQDDSISFAL